MKRVSSLLLLALALVLFVGAPTFAYQKADEQNTHAGMFVSATGNQFTMKAQGKEHTHTLAPDAKVIGPEGKECKITDIKAGQRIRVTTKPGDMTTALKVEVVKPKDNE